jgi:hypothetical protein
MQLPLPFTGDQDILLTRLKQLTNADIRLVLTDNGSSMISFRKEQVSPSSVSTVCFCRPPDVVLSLPASYQQADEDPTYTAVYQERTQLCRSVLPEDGPGCAGQIP